MIAQDRGKDALNEIDGDNQGTHAAQCGKG